MHRSMLYLVRKSGHAPYGGEIAAMTYQERLIVTAYPGYLMRDMQGFHKYAEEKLGVEIKSHQFG